MNIITLEIDSFVGLCADASHVYGTLKWCDKERAYHEQKLEHVITQEEAEALNRKDSCTSYRAGKFTYRFKTEQQVIAVALKYFNTLPGNNILVKGQFSAVIPDEILMLHPVDDVKFRQLAHLIQEIHRLEEAERYEESHELVGMFIELTEEGER